MKLPDKKKKENKMVKVLIETLVSSADNGDKNIKAMGYFQLTKTFCEKK